MNTRHPRRGTWLIDARNQEVAEDFEEAWATRDRGAFADLAVDFIGRDAFVRNKRQTGRAKDLGDIEGL